MAEEIFWIGDVMKKLFNSADEYLKGCDWKDLALIKFCLRSIGVLIGLSIPQKGKKIGGIAAGAIFGATYVAIMPKFFKILFKKD